LQRNLETRNPGNLVNPVQFFSSLVIACQAVVKRRLVTDHCVW